MKKMLPMKNGIKTFTKKNFAKKLREALSKALEEMLQRMSFRRKAFSQGEFERENASSHGTFRVPGMRRNASTAYTLSLLKRMKRLSRSGKAHRNDFSSFSDGRRRRPVLWGAATLSLAIMLACAGKGYIQYLAGNIDYFHIREMEIRGCNVSSPDEIRELGGVSYGVSLFDVHPKKTAKKITNHPWIDTVKIQRRWPDGLVVTVGEFRPEALLTHKSAKNGGLYYVSRKGTRFGPVKPGENIDYPVITGLDNLIDENERKSAIVEALFFLRLAKRNNPNLPAQLVSEINIDVAEGMVIHLAEHPFPIFFGRGEVKKKYEQLRKVLEILYRKQRNQAKIAQVEYIRMDYLTNKVLVAHKSGLVDYDRNT